MNVNQEMEHKIYLYLGFIRYKQISDFLKSKSLLGCHILITLVPTGETRAMDHCPYGDLHDVFMLS